MTKRVLLFVVVVLLAGNVPAQGDSKMFVQQVQHLKNEIHQASIADTTKIRLLTSLAALYFAYNETDSCKQYASQALDLLNAPGVQQMPKPGSAQMHHYLLLKAAAMEQTGNALYYENTFAAIDTFFNAIALRRNAGTLNGIGEDYFSIGYLYYVLNEYHIADSIYGLSIQAFRSIDDKNGMGRAYNWRAISMRENGKYADALENNLHALSIGRQVGDSSILTDAYLAIGFIYLHVKMFDNAIRNQQAALQIFKAVNDSAGIATVFNDMGVTYMRQGNYDLAMRNHLAAAAIREKHSDYGSIAGSYSYISDIAIIKGDYPQALYYQAEALKYAKLNKDIRFICQAYDNIGDIHLRMKDTAIALNNFYEALDIARQNKAAVLEAEALHKIAGVQISRGDIGAALELLKQAVAKTPVNEFSLRQEIYRDLYTSYTRRNDYKNALTSFTRYKEYSDSVAGKDKVEKLKNLTNQLDFENRQALMKASQEKQLAIQRAELQREKLNRNLGFAGFFIVIVLAIIYYVRLREKGKLNLALEQSLVDLKAAQAQLIHSEKMASLGELTAGIAHEIQNPLNFVNNFSEVSNELLNEMTDCINEGDLKEVAIIAESLKQNLEKIDRHGRRADAIVKGMLQHSRTSSGLKEPTDVNKLVNEYVRLSYHGLRAKNKNFNADFKTDFDESIGKINMIPQDMGRALLNLFNNAFYAVNEKSKNHEPNMNYAPLISVQTKKLNDMIEIIVKDNGDGIPESIKEKIFQPFFTTKPSGSGTGLGLSLVYDIIKAHGGEIQVETKEGEGSTFIIQLPFNP